MAATLLANRAIVRLSPLEESEDVGSFLQGLVTNDVGGPPPIYAGLLSAQGKTMFDFLIWRDGSDYLLDCEATAASALAKRLTLYRLRRRIAIEVDGDMCVHWSADGDRGVEDPRLSTLGRRWIDKAADRESADAAWLAHRLELGVAEGADELADILWLETNAIELHGVSFSKGCYVGQENTARMNWRQKINRRLIVVPLVDSVEKRRKAAYPHLGVAVDHLRVEDIDPAWLPGWLAA